MTNNAAGRLLTISGAAAGILWAVSTVGADIWLNAPDSEGDPARVEQVFLDREPAAWIMILGSVYLAVAIVFFAAAAARATSKSAHGLAALAGGVLLAVAMIVHQGIGRFAVLSAAHHHDQDSIHTLGYFDAVTWLLLGAGTGAFLLATGIASLQSRAMPKWLSVVTVVLGVIALLGPGALVFYFLAPAWFIGTSIAINRRTKAPLSQSHEVSTYAAARSELVSAEQRTRPASNGGS
jgi:hypothetical protein